MLNSEEIKPMALIVLELHLAQLVENLVKKNYRNLLERFGVALKTFLGLAMSKRYCQAVMKDKVSG